MATAKCFKSNVDCEGCESEHEETVLITRIKKYLEANKTKNLIYLSEIQSSLHATYPVSRLCDEETRNLPGSGSPLQESDANFKVLFPKFTFQTD